MRKWYKFDTCFIDHKIAFIDFLAESGIKYKLACDPCDYHFEVFCDADELKKINKWWSSDNKYNRP